MKLNCFVAMAFNSPETEFIYLNFIEKILKDMSINSRRVDKLNHQDRIDQRIRSEIEKADFVIADLTYARPSVYYEAGYAERILNKAVIYTMAQDHLGKQVSDRYGNFRVHFDLQNANIITWSIQDLNKFSEDLEKRIRFVISPIKKQNEIEEEFKKSRDGFANLSLTEKLNLITAYSKYLIQKSKYKKTSYFSRWSRTNKNSESKSIYYQNESGKLNYLNVNQCTESVTKKDFDNFHIYGSSIFPNPNNYQIFMEKFSNIHRLRKDFLIINLFTINNLLNNVTDNKLISYLKNYRHLGNSDIFYFSDEFGYKNKLYKINYGFIYIRKIKSLRDYEIRFLDNLKYLKAEFS